MLPFESRKSTIEVKNSSVYIRNILIDGEKGKRLKKKPIKELYSKIIRVGSAVKGRNTGGNFSSCLFLPAPNFVMNIYYFCNKIFKDI